MTYVEAQMLLCTHCMYKIPLIETAHTIMMMHIIIVPIAILALYLQINCMHTLMEKCHSYVISYRMLLQS